MNKKIQEQVLKESFEHFKFGNVYHKDIQEISEKAISRTIELMEKEIKELQENMVRPKDHQEKLDELKQQKAEFRKMIEDVFHIEKVKKDVYSFLKKKKIPKEFAFKEKYFWMNMENIQKELLAKLGDDHSPEDKSVGSIPIVKKVGLSSGTSKGCGKEYCASCKEVGKYCNESIPCGTKMPLLIGEKESLWLCSDCKKKTSTCICGHDEKEHGYLENLNMEIAGGCLAFPCKCKKFQEVGK